MDKLRIAVTLTFAALITSLPALAERPGHRYVWMDMVYEYNTPPMTIGGDSVTCDTNYLGSTTCTKDPSYTIPARSGSKVLSVHVDCTDRTYDAKGDRQGWKSWRQDAEVYKAASRRCSQY